MAGLVTFKVDGVSRFVFAQVRELKVILASCTDADLDDLCAAVLLARKKKFSVKARLIELRARELMGEVLQTRRHVTQKTVDEAVAAFVQVYGTLPRERHLMEMLHVGAKKVRRFDVVARRVKVSKGMLDAARGLGLLSPEEIREKKSLAGKKGSRALWNGKAKKRGSYAKQMEKRVSPKQTTETGANPQAVPHGSGWFLRTDYGRRKAGA